MTEVFKPYLDNSNRGRSNDLWLNCPRHEILSDKTFGYFARDHFNKGALDADQYVLTQATAGTFTQGDAEGGVGVLDAGSTTENQGIQIQHGQGEWVLPVAGAKIWFECRWKHVDAATSVADAFIGLSENDTSIIASGANSSANHVGFELINEDLTLDFVSEKATSRETDADVVTLVADTYVKTGFYIDGVTSITHYVNGASSGTVTDTDDIPIVEMRPSFVCQASGTAAANPTIHIDWWECFVEYRT